MKKVHPGILMSIGAVLGGVVGALAMHRPTREKVLGHIKTVHTHVIKTAKEKVNKLEA